MVIAYPQPAKAKSKLVCDAFIAGCGGGRASAQTTALESGGACFFGVVGIEHLLRLCVAEGRTFYLGDNAHFDRSRGRYFRFARNAWQVSTLQPPDHARAKALGLEVKPWRRDGRHIVVVEQSAHFLGMVGAAGWLARVLRDLRNVTDRELRVRPWRRDKDKAAATMQADLKGAWALVTHMSAAANEALLAGVPVFVSGPCAALPMASGKLADIERPRYPEGREQWAAGLAAAQWTLQELREGKAWQALNGDRDG